MSMVKLVLTAYIIKDCLIGRKTKEGIKSWNP